MTTGMDAAERIANWALDNLSKEAIERLVFMLDDGIDYMGAIHSARAKTALLSRNEVEK